MFWIRDPIEDDSRRLVRNRCEKKSKNKNFNCSKNSKNVFFGKTFKKIETLKVAKNTKNRGFGCPPQAENFENWGHFWVLPSRVSENP